MHSQYSIAACGVIILLQGNDLPEAVTLGGAYDRNGSPVVFGVTSINVAVGRRLQLHQRRRLFVLKAKSQHSMPIWLPPV